MLDRRKFFKRAIAAALLATAPTGASAQPQAIRRLVFVHGRSRQVREPALIRAEAAAALREGARKLGRALPSEFEFALAYYGDRLDSFISRSAIPLVSEIEPARVREYQPFLTFQAKIADDLRRKAGIRDEQVDAEYGRSTLPKTALNLRWVQANLRALDEYGPGMTRIAVETFTRDAYLYATRADLRQEIDEVIAKEFGQPAVVVGHSLGSIVAYNALRRETGAPRVPLYVTLGSPLGIPAVRDLLLPLRSPSPALGAWFNAFDPRDCLGMYPLDKTDFPTAAIENFGRASNPTSDHHGIVGYLDDAAVATKILGALGG